MTISAPSPVWSVLLRRISTRSPSGTPTRSATSSAEFGATERAREAKGDRRPGPLADHGVGAQVEHLGDVVGR
jgi:hypothetical protein